MKDEQKKGISKRSKGLWADPTKDENGLTYADRVKAGISAKAKKKKLEKLRLMKQADGRVQVRATNGKDTKVEDLPTPYVSTSKQKLIDEIESIRPHLGTTPLTDFTTTELEKHLEYLKNGKEEKTSYNVLERQVHKDIAEEPKEVEDEKPKEKKEKVKRTKKTDTKEQTIEEKQAELDKKVADAKKKVAKREKTKKKAEPKKKTRQAKLEERKEEPAKEGKSTYIVGGVEVSDDDLDL